MNRSLVLIIAGATFREAVRSRAFMGLLIIFSVAVLMSRLVGWISATDGDRVTTDLVLSLQSIIGVLVAVAMGTVLVHTEIRQMTLYTVLSRPVPRWQFVVGKFIGLALGLLIGQAAMLGIGLMYLAATGADVHHWLLIAGILTVMEVLVMAAVSLCLTALTSPLLAAVLGLAVYTLGHAVASLPDLINHLKGWQVIVASALASVIPNLGMFTYRNLAAAHIPISWTEMGMAMIYGVLWIILLVTVTVAVFRRKQL